MNRRIVHAVQKYVLNPPIKLLFAVGLAWPGYALLETTGRKTGKPRRTPVSYSCMSTRRRGEPVKARQTGSEFGDLGGFVADRTPDLVHKLCRNFGHVMGAACVFGALLENVLLGFTFCDEIAVHTNVSTADYLCHLRPPSVLSPFGGAAV